MKIILKTIDSKKDLDYGETFNSKKNLDIRRRLVPELRKSLTPNYRPSTEQITTWLNSLHKSRRSRNRIRESGRGVEDDRRMHQNSRVQEVSIPNVI
jgi:hypothetical protein